MHNLVQKAEATMKIWDKNIIKIVHGSAVNKEKNEPHTKTFTNSCFLQ